MHINRRRLKLLFVFCKENDFWSLELAIDNDDDEEDAEDEVVPFALRVRGFRFARGSNIIAGSGLVVGGAFDLSLSQKVVYPLHFRAKAVLNTYFLFRLKVLGLPLR